MIIFNYYSGVGEGSVYFVGVRLQKSSVRVLVDEKVDETRRLREGPAHLKAQRDRESSETKKTDREAEKEIERHTHIERERETREEETKSERRERETK